MSDAMSSHGKDAVSSHGEAGGPRGESEGARLWDRFESSPSSTPAREALILHYAPLVKYVAGRVASGLPKSVEQSDLVSYGMFGLIDAIDKFERDRGARFESYAVFRIRGAILDGLRSIDWVPRSVRARARRIEAAYAALESEHHRAPTDAELAAELGWSDGELQSALAEIAQTGLTALDEMLSLDTGDSVSLGDTIGTEGDSAGTEEFDRADNRQVLGDAISGLPERERTVLLLYYFESLTLAEIGQVIGVTESRVSQIHTKAMIHLRARLAVTVVDPS